MEKIFKGIDVSDIGEWSRFDPAMIIHEGYDIYSVVDSKDGFEIILKDSSNVEKVVKGKDIRILFDEGVDLYRNMDEHFSYGSASGASLFVKINNSKYITWLVNVSCCLGDKYATDIGLRHFMFIGNNDVLDIISSYDPEITFIDKIKD